jgi:hypothetical protein
MGDHFNKVLKFSLASNGKCQDVLLEEELNYSRPACTNSKSVTATDQMHSVQENAYVTQNKSAVQLDSKIFLY